MTKEKLRKKSTWTVWVDFIRKTTMAIERASCPVLNTLRFCTKNSSKLYNFPRKHLQFPSFFPRNFNSINGKLYTHGLFLNSSSSFSNTTQETPSQKLALLLEVEGYNNFSSFLCVHTDNSWAFMFVFRFFTDCIVFIVVLCNALFVLTTQLSNWTHFFAITVILFVKFNRENIDILRFRREMWEEKF